MKIKEALSSVRELESQLRKLNQKEKENPAVQELSSESTDAVSVLVQQSESNSARIKRVADIKNLVATGTYQPDSTKVAQSVIRDLF
jgi:anti-sigma28 factor (negative regulator of flagellin synthesis)